MYERMLDKLHRPAGEEFFAYCGGCRGLAEKADDYLLSECGCESLLRFPYGNSYGWSIKYFIKSRHICDLFAEKDAFTVMLRLSDAQFAKCYADLSDHAKELIDGKYPCGEGGWIHYRVLTEQQFNDIKMLLQLKVNQG